MKIAKIDYSRHENSPSWIGKSQEYGLMPVFAIAGKF